MNPESWCRAIELYHETVAHRPEERLSFLDQACNGDEELRTQVERLVRSHEASGDFIESPAFEVAPELLLEEPADALLGQLIGRYRIESLLGVGGMGEVYLALDERLGRKVALKLLPERLTADERQLRRFEHEARTASALNHPNILTVHEIGADANRHFIATEFIEGETLRSAMARGKINLRETLEIGLQIGSALAAAHKSGVLHRDIKPENIMLRPDAYVKVLDFGIAKLSEQPPTRPAHAASAQAQTEKGLVLGTAHYMSPEQARGQMVDVRTDIWSFAVVLYEMLAGTPPFEGETPSDCIASVLKTEAPPLALKTSEVPSHLGQIVQKALRKNKEERYQSVEEMLSDLRGVKEELDEVERPKSSAEYIVNKVKRHKTGALMALLLLVVATAGTIFYSYSARGDSLAVMPFIYVSPDPPSPAETSRDYLSDGLTDGLINSLSRVPKLKVIARASTFRYKGKEIDPRVVAQELGVRTILIGRMVQRGDDLSISFELVDAGDNHHLGGGQLERKLASLLVVQQDIVKEIFDKLRVRLTGEDERRVTKRPTENPEAYQLYLQGRYFWSKRSEENLKKSIEYYEYAIAKDPRFALAYAALADSYTVLPNYGSPISSREWRLKAKAATMRALELDDSIAEVHLNLATLKGSERDFAGAENEFRRSIELNPNYATAHQWYAALLSDLGRHEEAIAEAERASELDPLSVVIRATLGSRLRYARQYDKAIEQARRAIAMDKSLPIGHAILAEVYIGKGMYEEAIAEYESGWALKTEKSPEEAAHRATALKDAYRKNGAMGFWEKQLELAMEDMKRKPLDPQIVASIYARLDDKDHALQWLEKAYEEREDIAYINVDPDFDGIRSDPRFKDLMRRIGLPSAPAPSVAATQR